jgi:hypothetical protein
MARQVGGAPISRLASLIRGVSAGPGAHPGHLIAGRIRIMSLVLTPLPGSPWRAGPARCCSWLAAAVLTSLVPAQAAGPAEPAAPVQKKPPPAVAPTVPTAPAGLAFELISPAEVRRDRDARPKNEALVVPEARLRSLPGAPARALFIRVVAPTPQAAVAAPLRIELAFDSAPGARVVPSTFRILYGVLKIDLTERLRRFATISERGVVVEQAVVPDGLHRLFVQVADDKGNVAEQELLLRVGVTS